jgi:N-acetylneuraminate synthase
MVTLEIAGRKIGRGHTCFIIAEAGVAHNGKLKLAKELVDCAAASGADAVKFQTFSAEEVVCPDSPKAEYQKRSTGINESQLGMLKRLELSPEDHRHLMEHCRARGILFLSTPFDETSVQLLKQLDVSAFKIASGEITNWPFLAYVGAQRKPLILSTGMSYLSEVDEAIRVLRCAGCPALALLHCVSNYPANPTNANLRAISAMETAFQLPVGFSDHTLGVEVPLAAVALGACIVEKHFTLDKTLPGPDHQASASPDELRSLIKAIRTIESAMGDGIKRPASEESNVRQVARRSIVAREMIPSGTPLTREVVAFKRPGTGIPPSQLEFLLGRSTVRALQADSIITYADLA